MPVLVENDPVLEVAVPGFPGWLGCLRTVPVVGPAVIAALIASPLGQP